MMAEPGATEGSLATGRYELVSELTTNPLGPLWAARTLSGSEQGRLVAIRRVSTRGMDRSSIDRLIDDATTALDVRHAGVVATLDVLPEAERVSIVSEYVEGETVASLLQAAIAKQSPFPMSVALRICLDIAAALRAAKQRWPAETLEFPHGGLLPHSMLLAGFGEAMVSDLGASRAVPNLQSVREDENCARYRAPEQRLAGTAATEATDVYALGAVLWEMLANQPLPATPVSLDRLERSGPPIPETIVRIVERALRPGPDARLGTFDEMLALLSEPSVELAPAEQLVLTLDRLARSVLEARRGRVRAPLHSDRPDQSPPSNRPTLEPTAITVSRSERPTIHAIDLPAEPAGFSEHEHPTFSERAEGKPRGRARGKELAIVLSAAALPATIHRVEGLERLSTRAPAPTTRVKAWRLGLALLLVVGAGGAFLLVRSSGDAAVRSQAASMSAREASPPAALPVASASPVEPPGEATGAPAEATGAPSAASPISPEAAPLPKKPVGRKRDGDSFRPHGP